MSRQTKTFLLERFREMGIRPATRHGQNFLIDLNLHRLIVDSAQLTKQDVVLEIGTGTGAITQLVADQAGAVVKQEGKPNDLIERIRKNSYFEDIIPELDSLLNPSTFIGRCPEIVEKLVVAKVKPALEKYADALATAEVAELSV